MWFQTVRAERAPGGVLVRESPFRVKVGRLFSTTKEVFSRGSTATGAILIVIHSSSMRTHEAPSRCRGT
jgi:hypothetical protein